MSMLTTTATVKSMKSPPAGPIESEEAQLWISDDGALIEQPPWLWSEIYIMVVAVFFWCPLMVPMVVIMTLLSFPALFCHAVYVSLVPGDIERSWASFIALGVVGLLLSLPAIIVMSIYTGLTFVASHVVGMPWGVFVLGFAEVNRNFEELKAFCARTGGGCISWLDLVSAAVATGAHAGAWSLMLRIPVALVWNPFFKYFCTTNPWLYDCRVRYIAEWSAPIELDARKRVLRMTSMSSNLEQRSSSFSSIFSSKSNGLEESKKKKIIGGIDEEQQKAIAACYPLPPQWRQPSTVCYRGGLRLPSAPGLEFGSFIPQFTLTGHTGDIWEDTESAALPLSHTSERLASATTLSYLNPFHVLTGYSEISVRASCAIEHPVWAFVGAGRLAHAMLATYGRFILSPSAMKSKRPLSSTTFAQSSIAIFDPVIESARNSSNASLYAEEQSQTAEYEETDHKQSPDDIRVTSEDDIDYGILSRIEARRNGLDMAADEKKDSRPQSGLSSKQSDDFDSHDDYSSMSDESIDDNLVAVVVDPVEEIEFTEIFHDRKIGFSVALSMDKRRATSHIVVDEVYASCRNPNIQVGDEIRLLEHVEVLRDAIADEERQLVNFLALITRIRQGPRPIRIVFSRPPPISEEPQVRRVQLPRRPVSIQQRPRSRPVSLNLPDANHQWL